ncbi:MAG TPA: glycoside hydrolase family 43 protein [Bacteroidota bacterium]
MQLSPLSVIAACLLALIGPGCVKSTASRQQAPPSKTFINPILSAPSQDPWMILDGSRYFYCEARESVIVVRGANRITGIGQDPGRIVWRAPGSGPYSREVWAPELHHIGQKWYIYFAADDGKNEHHRMWVIEADNPLGPYSDPVKLETGGWAIDGTVVWDPANGVYFVWSGWPGEVDGEQNLYIARMRSPLSVDTPRTLLASPTEPWERNTMPICEGPEGLLHEGRLSIIYSASGSWTRDYCLGLLVFQGGNPLDPGAWVKRGPVFGSTDSVWGVGHCSIVPSTDGKEAWLLYHAKEKRENGWDDRSVRAQKISWNDDGTPALGVPLPVSRRIPEPE